MHEIKSIGVLQAAKVMSLLFFVVSEITGIVIALNALIHGRPHHAILAAVLIGPAYAVVGFLFYAAVSWLYNQIAARIGGVQIELVQR